MAQGLFDEIIEGKGNKLADVAELETASEADIFAVDFVEGTTNLVFSLWAALQNKTTGVLIGSFGLMVIDVLPRVYMKMLVYKILSRNKKYTKLQIFGRIIRYTALYLIPALFVILLYFITKGQCPGLLCFIAVVLYLLGVADKLISLLTHKYLKQQSTNTQGE